MKNILVTGVSTGIGYDAVRHFTAQGYRVFGTVRSESDATRLQNDFPNNFICLQFDVTDLEKIAHAKKQVEEILQGDSLTALVNNAGYAQAGPMALLSDKDFQQQIEVNLFGVRNVTNLFLPLLGAYKGFEGRPGKIINISSISGILNTPMNGAYCVAKHALESMTEVYRRELMMYGIQLATIQPGPIQSDLWDKNTKALDAYLSTDYGDMAYNTNQIIAKAEKDAQPAAVISNLVEEIIDNKKPRLSYIVHSNRMQTYLFTRLTPKRVVDWVLYRLLNKERPKP